MDDAIDYQQAWRQYKRRGRLWLALFVLYVPVVVGSALLTLKYWHTPNPAFVLAILWMSYTLYLGARINLWRCPRCGQCFAGTWWYNKGIFAKQCVNCGLLKYSNEQVSSLPSTPTADAVDQESAS